jgi:hypothetical protein
MLKIFIGMVLGYLLFTSPQARRITGDLLRSAAETISPEEERHQPPASINQTTKPALKEFDAKTNNAPLRIEHPDIQ